MRYFIYGSFLILVLFSMSCSRFMPFNKRVSNGSASIMRAKQFTDSAGTLFFSFYDATKRSALAYMTPDGGLRVLAENNPDAAANRAFDLISKLNLSATGKDSLTASNQLTMARTIVQLTEKSPTDILVRDALYRLNEMYLNTLCLNCGGAKPDTLNARCDTCSQALTSSNYIALFMKVLTTAETMSSSDAKSAEAKVNQLKILDSIKVLKDSIAKLNAKPAVKTIDSSKVDTSKIKKTTISNNYRPGNRINNGLNTSLQSRFTNPCLDDLRKREFAFGKIPSSPFISFILYRYFPLRERYATPISLSSGYPRLIHNTRSFDT